MPSVEVGKNKVDGHPLQGCQKPAGVLGGRSGRENELLGELYAHGQGHHVGCVVQRLPAWGNVRKRVQRFAVRHQEYSARDRYGMETIRRVGGTRERSRIRQVYKNNNSFLIFVLVYNRNFR